MEPALGSAVSKSWLWVRPFLTSAISRIAPLMDTLYTGNARPLYGKVSGLAGQRGALTREICSGVWKESANERSSGERKPAMSSTAKKVSRNELRVWLSERPP